MQYIVNHTKQIAIEAETPEEAVQKALNGEGTTISVNFGGNPRPQAPARAVMPTTIPAITAK